jgi:hypothetical protein
MVLCVEINRASGQEPLAFFMSDPQLLFPLARRSFPAIRLNFVQSVLAGVATSPSAWYSYFASPLLQVFTNDHPIKNSHYEALPLIVV